MNKIFGKILVASAAAALLNTQGCVTAAIVGVGAAAVVGTQTAVDRRTIGSQVDDSAIESVASDEIKSLDPLGYEQSHIGTTSINGRILIHGQTQSKTIKNGIKTRVAKIKGVTEVFDYVTLGESVSVSTRSADSWITTKVKTSFVGERSISTNNFKVVTEDGVVYLMGLVTKEEGATAAKLASEIEGVQKVVTLFEYIETDVNGRLKEQQATKENSQSKKNNESAAIASTDDVETIEITEEPAGASNLVNASKPAASSAGDAVIE